MNTVSLVGSLSRRAGGLFESVRRLHQALLAGGACPSDPATAGPKNPWDPVRVSVLGVEDEFTSVDSVAWRPVSLYPCRRLGPRVLNYAPQMLPQLHRLGPDLVHVHGLWQLSSLAALRWHRRTRRPYLVSPHGMLDPWAIRNSRLKKRLAWFGYEHAHLSSAACIRALCLPELNSIRALGLTNPVCLIPNGVDLPEPEPNPLTPAPERPLGPSLSGRKLLLYLGRIHPKKGLVGLVQAWAETTPPRGPWILVVAGWDQNGHEQELKKLAGRLNLPWVGAGHPACPETRIIFAGPQFGAAKRLWLQHCQAFILPSFSEGLPMAVLEAWAFAKPVLMSAQCNLAEGFARGAARLVEPNVQSLARGLVELFSTPDPILARSGENGRSLVATRFTWPRVAAQLQTVYEWLLGSAAEPDCLVKP
jgi:poly(glycerol-phosphate) alpha-glucosyltransferase